MNQNAMLSKFPACFRDILFAQRLLASAGLYAGKLDGVYGPKTRAGLEEWLCLYHQTREQPLQSRRTESCILSLHPSMQAKARLLLSELSTGAAVMSAPLWQISVGIISGTRSYREQDDLYAKGRRYPGPRVTNARGGQSFHNFGIAFDIGLFSSGRYLQDSPHYDTVGAVGMSLGLEWGGEWRMKDKPHFQLILWGKPSMLEIRSRFESGKGWDGWL